MKIRTTEKDAAAGTKSVFCALLCVVLLVLVMPLASRAQQYSGTITGTVTDQTGAAVAGATVVVTNVGTNATTSVNTNEQGHYTFAQLPVGIYEIRVKQASFKESLTKGIEVHTSTDTEINVALELGAANETMTVEASDVQVQTTTAVVGEVVAGTQVRELPLNGENFMGLVTLSPGVSTSNDFDGRGKGLTGGSNFSVNGNPYTNNLFLVDGVNNNDMGSGRTILVYPSVDAIAEFKMLRNSYGPEYGQASGAIISITTKSGENQFHGGVFYAGRNDVLNANDWFSNNNNTGKAKLRRNDWGYNASGPIIKNKLFAWWNQEWNHEIRGQSVSACVPTAAQKAGDFSGPAVCGASAPVIPVGLQAPGNPLQVANPDAAGLLLAQFYPDPNVPGATGSQNNWAAQETQKPFWKEWNVRVDYDITSKHRATFRYTKDSWTSPSPNPNLFWGDSFFPTINSDWSQPSKSVMAKLTSQLSNTLVNDFEFGYGNNAIITTLAGTGAAGLSAVDYISQLNALIPTAWPASLKQTGAFINGGANWGGLQPYGNGQTMWNIAPYGNHEDLYSVQDNISKVHGNHLFKIGGYYSTNAKVEDNNGGTDQPTFNTNNSGLQSCPPGSPVGCAPGVPTGNSLANLLIPGQVFVSNENSINALDRRIWHDIELYFGDTWKLSHNVTLSLGARWSFYREPYSETNAQASFSLAAYDPTRPASDACNGVIIVPNTTPCQDAAANLATLGVSLPLSNGTPGINRALVENNNHNIAPRFGIAWDVRGDGKTAVRVGGGQFFQREIVGIGRTLSGTAPFVINAQDVRTLQTATPLANPSVSPNAAKDPRAIAPNSWQWNVSVERELFRNAALQLGYVGNTGIHLTSMADLNSIPSEFWNETAFLNGSALNSFRPAGNFGTIGLFDRAGHSTYHSLQALFRARTGNFSNFQVSYTYSHSIADVELDNSSGGLNQEAFTDPTNTGIDKGNTNINRPHIFVANEVFYLPKLANKGAFVEKTLGGWELNSIITVTSGASLSVFSNGASGANGSTLNSLTGTGFGNNQRPNVTGVGCNDGENGKQILNPAAFTFVGYTLGTIGNAPRGYCRGPNNRNVDVQLAKNWSFRERFRLKFSMDFFNLFNHANFVGTQLQASGFNAQNLVCGATACSPTNNVVTDYNTGANANFGQAVAVHNGRELQYTLRFSF